MCESCARVVCCVVGCVGAHDDDCRPRTGTRRRYRNCSRICNNSSIAPLYIRSSPHREAPPHQMAPPTTPRTAPEASAPIEGTSLSLSRSKSGRPHQRQHWHRRTFSTNYIKRQESGGKGKAGAGAVDDAAAGAAGDAPAAAPTAGSAGAKKKASNPKDHPHFVWILWGSFVLTINAGFIVSTAGKKWLLVHSHAYLGGRTCQFG